MLTSTARRKSPNRTDRTIKPHSSHNGPAVHSSGRSVSNGHESSVACLVCHCVSRQVPAWGLSDINLLCTAGCSRPSGRDRFIFAVKCRRHWQSRFLPHRQTRFLRTSLAASVPTYLTGNLGSYVSHWQSQFPPHWQSQFLPHWLSRFLRTSLAVSVPTYLTDSLGSYLTDNLSFYLTGNLIPFVPHWQSRFLPHWQYSFKHCTSGILTSHIRSNFTSLPHWQSHFLPH